MFHHLTLVVSLAIFVSVFSRSIEAQLFVQFEANGTALNGDSADPAHADWSDLGSLSLIFTGGGTSQTSLSTRFSMGADSTWPQMVQAWNNNENLLINVETFIGGILTDVYAYSLAGFTDLSISYGGSAGGIVSGIINANEVLIRHDPSGQETIWDWAAPVSTITGFLGDYDGDSDVDVADYDKWTDQFGATMGNLGGGADGNADGLVNAADYTVWRDHQVGSGEPIPEPVASFLLLIGTGGIALLRRVRFH